MIFLSNIDYDVARALDAGVLVFSFLLLSQRRLFSLLTNFGLQAMVLAVAATWQAYAQNAPHLYVTAAITLVFKAIFIPIVLRHIVINFKIHRTIEPVFGGGITLMLGIALVSLAILLVFPITAGASIFARETLSVALAVVLLGFLMMITRYNAISQVVGLMSIENGLILGAVGVKGMPMVVELLIAFSVMVAFIIFGILFFHIRERFDTLDIRELESFRGERQP